MPQFVYQARRGSKKLKGQLTALDKASALEELRRQGLVVLSVSPYQNQMLSTEIYIGNPVKPVHFIMYCRQLATLIRAGISIVEATSILAEQSESKPLRKALHEVNGALIRGITFSAAVQEHKRIFPPMFINMIRAGEETGDLEGTLDRLARFFEKDHVTREKMKSALTYPIVVGFIALAAVVYLLKAVVPQFVSMFEDMNAELPAVTKMVLAVSKSIEHQWWLWLLGVIFVLIVFMGARRTDRGSYVIDYLQLKFPVFGPLKQKGAIALMARTLSSLYSSSVPILQSLVIVETVVGNRVVGSYIHNSAESLRQGKPLSEPLRKAWVFPPMVTQMIAIGEETGALDHMLEKVADFYEMEVENTVDRLKSLIEPLLLVFLAGMVGTIVAAIMLPMFSLYSNFG